MLHDVLTACRGVAVSIIAVVQGVGSSFKYHLYKHADCAEVIFGHSA